ncbi:ORF54 [Retroperitoneal fibromatosis-associated herpesvirus]|uniref:ORF54 n=1 Tax=Retroperitoneal fibromatosis-associated herpesvirus TaxID=111469 RepID=U5NIX9_9GAMA|nr:ORF54 [Retroperitoneal fibromatosis-associated herpesvirus]AGY30736.1 ORF54 [Retroperitoneal fibromatosis-associated herpesvirus]
MDPMAAWGPKVEYVLESSRFSLASLPGTCRLKLVNQFPLVVRACQPLIVPLGLHLTRVPSCAFLLTVETENTIRGHVGLIDGGFQGELKAILVNKEEFPVTLYKGELTVYLSALNYTVPDLPPLPFLHQPRYFLDAGFDVSATHHLYIPPTVRIPFELRLGASAPEIPTSHIPVALGRSGLACRGLVMDISRWKQDGLRLKFYNYSGDSWVIRPGDRICQIVFIEKKQLLQGWKKFLRHIKLAPGICFRPANVMFYEEGPTDLKQNDEESGLINTPRIEETNPFVRGEKGLGSSGLGCDEGRESNEQSG